MRRSTGRVPIAQPPGNDTIASPIRGSKPYSRVQVGVPLEPQPEEALTNQTREDVALD